MTWEIAFVIVGMTWALVVFLLVRTERLRESENHLNRIDAAISSHEKEIEWLKSCWRKSLEIK